MSGHGDPSRLPIFVLGMPRSGTTLVEQILASHRKVHGAGEIKDLDAVARERCDWRAGDLYPEYMPAIAPERLRELGARLRGAPACLFADRRADHRQDALELLLRRASSTWRCRMRGSSTRAATRSTPACPALRSCSRAPRTTATSSASSAATTADTTS